MITVLKDCFQDMDPFYLMALSMTCREYNKAFCVTKDRLIAHVKLYEYTSQAYVDWIYDTFGSPKSVIRDIIDVCLINAMTNHFKQTVIHVPHNIENVKFCSHISYEMYDYYVAECQKMRNNDVKFAYAVLAKFNVGVGLHKCWIDSRVVRMMKSIVYERYDMK